MQAENVVGIGVDLVEIDRIRSAMRRWGERFVDRVFCESERDDCDNRSRPWIHYAGRFAVKEAVAKALGTGVGVGARLNWLDIEVVSGSGAPSVRFSSEAERVCLKRGVKSVFISLSHARDYAVAQALLTGES